MNSSQKLKARFILLLMFLSTAALVFSLYWTQIEYGPSYVAKANRQYAKPAADIFDRGSIYFSSKDQDKITAATLGSGYIVFINPSLIVDPQNTYQALAQYLKIDKDDFFDKAAKINDHYEELAGQISEETSMSIKNLGLAGVGIIKENWRQYPGGILAAHEIGIIGEDQSSNQITGRYGLERSYETVLGRSGSAQNTNSFARLFSELKGSVFGSSELTQGDIVTTIEPTAQKYLEKILGQASSVWHPDEIGGIIIDPSTGEVVAMSSLPTFDPNNTAGVKDANLFANPLVEHVYEMGSIMKPLTMATALDSGAETADSTYDDTGTLTLSGKKISNYDGKARGVIPMQEILSQSLNVGAATIALKVGKDDFAKYFTSFGLTVKTGVDLPNEATGITGSLKTGRDVEIATAAYGQGIAISPINMARALSILANGGYVVTPHLVKEIDHSDGQVETKIFPKTGPVLKKQTVDEVTKMLVQVVDKVLVKGAIKMNRYSIAAKTGTAQIPDHVNGGYYSDRYLHSFFGYFPAYNPKFLVFLYQIYPKGAEYASATLTEPFDQITKFLIDYYNIAPDR